MSIATLERAIVAEARTVLSNSKLRNKDIMEWSTSTVGVRDGEVQAFLPELRIWIAVMRACDKRKST